MTKPEPVVGGASKPADPDVIVVGESVRGPDVQFVKENNKVLLFTNDMPCMLCLLLTADFLLSAQVVEVEDSDDEILDEQCSRIATDPRIMHMDDGRNTASVDGSVEVNINRPEGERRVCVAPRLADILKPHQVRECCDV